MDNTYRLILDSYAKRLISTNSRTRTIFYSKDNNYICDLSKISYRVGKNLFVSLLKENKECKIRWKEGSQKEVIDTLKNYVNGLINSDEVIGKYGLFTASELEILKNEKDYINCYNRYESKMVKSFSSVSKIAENNASIIKEKGKDDLYIGYPYIQGRFNKDKVVRAPLVLHKVNVNKTGEYITISCNSTKLLNPVFVMSYLVENNITYTDSLDFEILEEDYMDSAWKILNDIGIKFENKVNDYSFTNMLSLTKKEFKDKYNYQDNQFEILDYIALGIFPISDKKIYDDVKSLKDDENINAMLNSFYDSKSEYGVFDDENKKINERKFKYITSLDFSQKRVLEESLDKNLIIQGPPGTGKSQVIVNIAANLLLNRKNTLFCSEKRTATDVIYNRLGRLSSFALLLHDPVSEKNGFYESIVNSIENIKGAIEKYKKQSFSFNQDQKIENFFNDTEKYNDIISKEYKGFSFKEIFNYKDEELKYESKFSNLYNLVNDRNDLLEAIYKYEGSGLYQIALKWNSELKKDFYIRNKINMNNKSYFLYDKYNEVISIKNNYLRNLEVNNYLFDKKEKKSFFKKMFGKNEKLSNECLEFLESINVSVFSKKPFVNEIEKIVYELKFGCNLSNEDILKYFSIYISKKMAEEIDVDFIKNYTENFQCSMEESFEVMNSKQEDSISFIARSCSADIKEKLSSPLYNDKIQKLLGEINRKRKPPIKVVFEKYFEILKILFPIWIMTPDVVSSVVPLKAGIFDKVIFDEASQLFIERAVPAISRGKSIIICGDSKQLRPVLFFESRYDETDEDVLADIEQETALTENSLLDYVTTSNKYSSNMLRYHYRCHYKELINFSNYAFYEGRLVFANNIKGNEKTPLETINVDGNWDGEKNELEARKIIELVKHILFNRKDNETIGIVALNVNQRDLILELLEEECKNDKKFASSYLQEKERKNSKNGEDESIFVKNLENVQGDERDVIIFSISYSKNEKEKIGSSLGEIQRVYGENRLNVAISRAKKKVYIVKSFMGDDLAINESNNGPRFFKKYLQYADALNNNELKAVDGILSSLISEEEKNKVAVKSYMGEEIYCRLINDIDKNLYDIKKEINIGSFNINVAVYDKASKAYLFGINCVEDKWNVEDVYKKFYLENRGWSIYNVWMTDWVINKEEEYKRICGLFNIKS